jgi:uncharacterized protein YjiS (DUF1127 family)
MTKIIPPTTPTKRKWVWRWGDWRLYITHHCALKQKEKHQLRDVLNKISNPKNE